MCSKLLKFLRFKSCKISSPNVLSYNLKVTFQKIIKVANETFCSWKYWDFLCVELNFANLILERKNKFKLLNHLYTLFFELNHVSYILFENTFNDKRFILDEKLKVLNIFASHDNTIEEKVKFDRKNFGQEQMYNTFKWHFNKHASNTFEK